MDQLTAASTWELMFRWLNFSRPTTSILSMGRTRVKSRLLRCWRRLSRDMEAKVESFASSTYWCSKMRVCGRWHPSISTMESQLREVSALASTVSSATSLNAISLAFWWQKKTWSSIPKGQLRPSGPKSGLTGSESKQTTKMSSSTNINKPTVAWFKRSLGWGEMLWWIRKQSYVEESLPGLEWQCLRMYVKK